MTDQFALPTNRLYLIRDDLTRRKIPFVDLISGNVNAHGIHFPQRILEQAIKKGLKSGRTYRPDPMGHRQAREAISRNYQAEDILIPAKQILLTPGTSISYWYAFQLLADTGDEILAPLPSYPLFESIAALSGVTLTPYHLKEAGRWAIDFKHLEAAITPRTKALILISPHNPTGAVATKEEVQQLAAIAMEKKLAIISDEVFAPFIYNSDPPVLPRPASTSAPLVITLNGLSKMLALPGHKIGWIAVTGKPALVEKSMKTLEMISDTFLPVNESAQYAVPTLLNNSKIFQKSYRTEISKRLLFSIDLLCASEKPVFLPPEGGFFIPLRLKKDQDEEEIACRLLEKKRILVHPGYFYDMEGQHLVFSFVSRPAVLRRAIETIIHEIS